MAHEKAGLPKPVPTSGGLGWKLEVRGFSACWGSIWGKDSPAAEASLPVAGAGGPGSSYSSEAMGAIDLFNMIIKPQVQLLSLFRIMTRVSGIFSDTLIADFSF